jgi:hypothetical protein
MMNASTACKESKSRLAIVFETFLLLGFILSGTLRSFIPLLVAGVLFCISAIYWRNDAQRQKYHTGWIASALVLLVVTLAFAIYFRK